MKDPIEPSRSLLVSSRLFNLEDEAHHAFQIDESISLLVIAEHIEVLTFEVLLHLISLFWELVVVLVIVCIVNFSATLVKELSNNADNL